MAWLATATAGQKGQTRGSASAIESDVRQEAKDAASCFFNDLWHLNGNRPRGAGGGGGGGSTRSVAGGPC
jgi:hypothetical protein